MIDDGNSEPVQNGMEQKYKYEFYRGGIESKIIMDNNDAEKESEE